MPSYHRLGLAAERYDNLKKENWMFLFVTIMLHMTQLKVGRKLKVSKFLAKIVKEVKDWSMEL